VPPCASGVVAGRPPPPPVLFPGSFTFAPSGRLLALRWGAESPWGGGPGTVYGVVASEVWDAVAGKKLLDLPEGQARAADNPATFLAFAPDGKTLYSRGVSDQAVHALE